jgi:DNA gyrase/topoisomerase IV subunit A
MIRDSDIRWWVLEARKHPECAPEIIEQLAARLIELDAQNEQLRAQLALIQSHAQQADGAAELAEARRQLAELRRLLADHLALEPSILLITRTGEAARLPLSRVTRIARDGAPVLGRPTLAQLWGVLVARPQERLLMLSAAGVGREAAVSMLPTLEEGAAWPMGEGHAAPLGGPFEPRDPLSAAVVVGEPPRLWTVVTRRGWVRQHLAAAFARELATGLPMAISPRARDVPVAIVNGDPGELMVFTRWGRCARFPQRAISAQGDAALELEEDDQVVGALPLADEGEIVLATASGATMRRSTTQVKARVQPGGPGQSLIQAFDLMAVFLHQPHADLLLLTHSGRLLTHPADLIPLHERIGKGTPVGQLARDPVIAMALVPRLAAS